ncbi:disintegrin and metalloproteinase domain-containing protein 8a [Aplochiton taeniatus]
MVIPQKLEIRHTGTYSSQKAFSEVVAYSLSLGGQNYTLHLEKNRDLIGKDYSVIHYSEHGAEVTTTPKHEDHCYYHGHIVDEENSSASVGLCSGIKGVVRLREQVYLIEPLASVEVGDQAESDAAKGEELHAVYKQEHLRRKRTTCFHENKTSYDHGSFPSGLIQRSSLKSMAQTKVITGKPRIVEMVLVVDNKEYNNLGSRKSVEARMLEVANHVDKLYRPLGLRVMLVGLEVWSYKDQIEVSTNPEHTLTRFLQWRQENLVKKIRHDNAQLVTGVDFVGTTVGLATTSAMCTSSSGAVNEDHNPNPIGVASTLAHEMGHNLGMSHDKEHCSCRTSASAKGCIMAESVGLVYPELFSSCSVQQLNQFLMEVNPSCLLDTPSTSRVYGGPVCGNAFLEAGEECDCGTVEECKTSCCNASTCRLNVGAQCADGECCQNCQFRQTGSVCRSSAGDCDLPEYCSGFSASCPADAFTQNGLPCDRRSGYCYNGQCPSHKQHCKRLWGPDAEVAADACFYKNSLDKQCRGPPYGFQRCSDGDIKCGKLFCSGGWEFPVTARKTFQTLPTGGTCNLATMDPRDRSEDLGMVPMGTKCGHNMVCYDHRCQNIQVYGKDDCSAKCNSHGVCNHEKRCHCDPGWAPPFCDIKLSEMPRADAAVIGVSSVVGLLLLVTLVIGGVFCFKSVRNRLPKRQLYSNCGQSNPLFQSGSVGGSPRQGPPRISQPMFVESSAKQACKPLSQSAAPPLCRPLTSALVPCRAAPLVSVPRPQIYNRAPLLDPFQ